MRAAFVLLASALSTACGAQSEERANGQETNQVAGSVAPAPAPPAQSQRRPAPHTAPWSASGYALNGTEPFWGGSVTGTTVRYMTPEDQFGDVIETRISLEGERETYSGSWRGSAFVLTLTRGPCSDGMSERVYAFSAELRARGETRRGCADPQ